MITPFYICTREVSGSGVFLAHQIQAFLMITQKMKIRMRTNLLSQVRIIPAMIGKTRFLSTQRQIGVLRTLFSTFDGKGTIR